MLEIPHLGRTPQTWTLHQASRVTSRTALGLLDAGHIPQAPLASTPADLVRVGLKRWLDAQAGKLRLFSFCLNYTDWSKPGSALLGQTHAGAMVTLEPRHWTDLAIGKRITELQRAVPGLGETVLHWIDAVSEKRIPIHTPPRAFDLCCWFEWRGEYDESQVLEDLKAEGESPETVELVTRKAWDAEQPTWASQPRVRVPRRRLEQLAHPRRKQLSGKVARALLALFDTLNDAPTFEQEDDHPVMPFSCWLRWSETDLAARVWDNYSEMVASGGEYSEHITFFEHVDSEELGPQLAAWLDHLVPFFTMVRALEDLIVLLAPSPRNLAEVFRGY